MIRSVLLGSIADFKTGPFGTQLHADEYVPDGIPIINVKNIGYGSIIGEDIDYVSPETLARLSEHTLRENDIVFARKGSIDRHAIINNKYDGCMQGSDCIRARVYCPNVNPKFLSHYLNLNSVKMQLVNSAVGSTMPSMNTDILKSIEIHLPEIEVQNCIEYLLSEIECKISNNNAICVDLESMAKLLYDYWFVQFDFPDENGKPYKSSGGKMVWNEELKREIPDGWKVKPLSKVLCLLRDGTHNPPKRIDSGIPLLTGTMFGDYFLDYSQATYITEDDYYTIHKQYKPNAGDIVITKIGTLGNVNYLRDKDIPIAIHCNSALLRFPDDYCGMFAFQYCKSKEFFARLKAAKGQSVQEFCSLDSIGSILMLVPDHKLTARYNDNMKSVLNQMINTQSENQELASLRDFLLPMLMNGQVKVKKEDDNE